MPGSRSRWRTMTAGASVCPAANQCGASRRSSVRMVVTGDASREDAVPAVGGTLVAANVVVGEAQGRRTDAERGSSVKGKEPAEADAGLEAGGEGEATSTGAGADGGRGKGKGRADNGSAKACRGRSSMDCSGGGRLGEGSGRLDGSGGRSARNERLNVLGGEGSSKQPVPDKDEGESNGGGKRARGGTQCQHNRQRSSCKECGGASICQHNRQRTHARSAEGRASASTIGEGAHTRECGGASICQLNRRWRRCKTCKTDGRANATRSGGAPKGSALG